MRRLAFAIVPVGVLLAAQLAPPALAQRAKPATALPTHPVPPVASTARRAVALEARLVGDEKRTRLVFDLTRRVDLQAFTLADPYRVVVDLPDVTFDLPVGAGREGRGLIAAYRYGLFAPGKARVVIDAKGPVAIDKAYVVDPVDGQPARLVVDLVRSDRESFLRAAATQKNDRASTPTALRDEPVRDHRPIIVIDPGHGGIDTGALAPSGEAEKDVVLAVSHKLRDRLQRSGRFRVVMTRDHDTFIPLPERVKIARASGAALFISVHADSLARGEGDARGATVYTVAERASDAEAARLAEKENKADLIAGVDLSDAPDEVADILFDLAHRETKNFSNHFARTLVGQLKSAARLHPRPLRAAGFRVLKAPDVPSVLLELGYLSSKEDVKLLSSEAWRDKVADSLVTAVETFFSTKMAASAN